MKKKILTIIIAIIIFGTGSASAYYDKTISVSRTTINPQLASCEGNCSPGGLSYLNWQIASSILHKVGVSSGTVYQTGSNYSVAKGQEINFAYTPETPFFNFLGKTFDTPYGFWVPKGYDFFDKMDTYKTDMLALRYIPNYTFWIMPFLYEGNNYLECYNKHTNCFAGYTYMTLLAETPDVEMVSDNNSVIICSGMKCTAKANGTANLTAMIHSFNTKLNVSFFEPVSVLFGKVSGGYKVMGNGLYNIAPDLSQGTAMKMSWNMNVVNNLAPSAPTIVGPEEVVAFRTYPFTLSAVDPEGDKLRFGIDSNMDGNIDWWNPGTATVASGSNYVTSSNGVYHATQLMEIVENEGLHTFQVLAQDQYGNNSPWTQHAVRFAKYTCTPFDIDGNPCPEGGQLCPDDNYGLFADMPFSVPQSGCTEATKCECIPAPGNIINPVFLTDPSADPIISAPPSSIISSVGDPGVCGSAGRSSYSCQVPQGNTALCSSGTPSNVALKNNKWEWTCSGTACSTLRLCPQREVNP